MCLSIVFVHLSLDVDVLPCHVQEVGRIPVYRSIVVAPGSNAWRERELLSLYVIE